MEYAIFTNDINIVRQTGGVWYDNIYPHINGRGNSFGSVKIDMRLPKEYIQDVVIPSCYFAESIFILNENRKWEVTNVSKIFEILNQ